MKAYLDLDTVAYRCAASCEPTKTKHEREDLATAIRRADELVFRILADCETDEYEGFLSGSDNFRKLLYPAYKANRDNIRRPEHLQPVREFLVSEWGAKVSTGYEADDAIGIAYRNDGIIVSVDKDFLQIPGRHYNPVTLERKVLSDVQADFNFWCAMLIGDRADNVPGVPGIGAVKAPRILCSVPRDSLKARVFEIYEQYDLDFHMTYKLLRILRSEEEWFEIENVLRESQGAWATEDSGSGDLIEVPATDAA